MIIVFSNKQIRLSKAILIENDVTICNDKTIAEIFNDFFYKYYYKLKSGSNTFEDDLNTIFEL